MNKKYYIEAMDEIKVSQKCKMEVLEKMNEKKNKIALKLSLSMACVVAIAVGIMIPMQFKNKNNVNGKQNPIIAQNLPNIENYEQLYKTFKNIQKDSNYSNARKGLIEDVTISDGLTLNAESAVVEDSVSSDISKEYSDTNVQVNGVDEADIVKTDGNYIYYVANQRIVIIDAKNKEKVNEIYADNDNNISEIYIKDNKLVAISYGYKDMIMPYEYDETKISYGNDRVTYANVYNVKDKLNIELEREIAVDGYYLTSRMIDENVYLITNKVLYSICRNNDIGELEETEMLPKYVDSITGESEKCVPYNCIYYIPEGNSSSYLNIASFNINKNSEVQISSYIGAGDEVYASANNLYVTQTNYEYEPSIGFDGITVFELATKIYKFGLEGSNVNYLCEGVVPGEILNQFSMDEKDGYFRIATTDSNTWNDEDNTNNLYVLNENLKIVGKVEKLAPGERIYSVRFMGDRAYMVTFVETDPLFVIDLSNPKKPKVLGELKIPGFSNYLHPYDENHIIGIGEDTEVKENSYGEFVTTTGMKMALFDVTDPTNPIEMYKTKIGDSGTYSEVLYNHKAFLFSKEKNLLAFPVTIQNNTTYDSHIMQGAIVYNIDLKEGFKLKGFITHKEKNLEDSYSYNNYDTDIERIIYIENELFTLSPEIVGVTDLETMKKVKDIKLLEMIDIAEEVTYIVNDENEIEVNETKINETDIEDGPIVEIN